MDYGDRLVSLRNWYITELNQLKTKYKELELHPSTQRKKYVSFNSEIEKIGERGDREISPLIQEGGRVDTSIRQCACDLECILEGNKWNCRRKKK